LVQEKDDCCLSRLAFDSRVLGGKEGPFAFFHVVFLGALALARGKLARRIVATICLSF